jgi:CRP/FNR family cyclic AMP-dependent transcriptional regulator
MRGHLIQSERKNSKPSLPQHWRLKGRLMKIDDNLEAQLREHAFLKELPEEYLSYLADIGAIRRFAANQRVFHAGWAAEHFFLILSGSVQLETFVPGRGTVIIQTLGPGEALGWSWLFPPYEWQFTPVTVAITEVVAFEASELRRKARECPEFRIEMLSRITRSLIERLQATRRHLIDIHEMQP